LFLYCGLVSQHEPFSKFLNSLSHRRRPIVIFDDYDMPMRSSYEHIFGLKDDVWSIFDMVDSIWEPLINEYKDCRKVITAGKYRPIQGTCQVQRCLT
jgi:hypothetical protein